MLDFQIPYTSKAVGPIMPKIEQQYQSLHNLIHFNNGFFQQEKDSLKQKQEDELTRLHEQLEGEDPEFLIAKETEIADRYQWEDEVLFYTENNFYHAAFIMAYSYFESVIPSICIAKNKAPGFRVQQNIEKLLKSYNLTFSSDIYASYLYVVGDLRIVRNHLTHNYNTPTEWETQDDVDDAEKKKIENYINNHLDELAIIKQEADKNIGLTLQSNDKLDRSSILVRVNYKYVEQAIRNIYSVLSVLCALLDLNKPEKDKSERMG